ncbi:unnamed protein product [Ectocarpus fasciculatus]
MRILHMQTLPRSTRLVLTAQQSFTSPARPAGARAADDQVVERVDGGAAVQVNRGPSRGGMTVEEAQQAFLSRLLLVLGSFVVLCLVLF